MSALSDLLRGRGAHVDPFKVLDDMDSALAGRRLPGAPQTIWQLLVHMNYWMTYELKSIEGPEASYPEHAAEGWPSEDGPADRAAWDREVGRFKDQIDQLARLAEARASTLARIAHPKKGTTVEDVLWMLVAHNSYHLGQLVQLRRAHGAWPPPGGGDTW